MGIKILYCNTYKYLQMYKYLQIMNMLSSNTSGFFTDLVSIVYTF